MTNNPTIDGVSRWLIEQSATFLEAHSSQPSIESNLAADLRALLGADHTGDSNAMVAPAVERQEPTCKRCGDRGTITSFMHCSEGGVPYENGPIECIEECACVGHQSTIAQLEDKLNKAINLDFQRRETIAGLEARVQDLEGGRGEPVAWMFKYLSHSDSPPYRSFEVTDFHQNQKAPGIAQHTPLYTAPPAPVVVMLPELTDEQRDIEVTEMAEFMSGLSGGLRHFAGYLIDAGWRKQNACLDATAALNGVKK